MFQGREQQLFLYMQATLARHTGKVGRKRARRFNFSKDLGRKDSPPESHDKKEMSQMMRGKISLQRQPISELCKMLTGEVRAVAVDETGLVGRYGLVIPYQPGR